MLRLSIVLHDGLAAPIYELIEAGGYLASSREAKLLENSRPAALSDPDISFVIVDLEQGNELVDQAMLAPVIKVVRMQTNDIRNKADRSFNMEINSEKIEQIVKQVLQGMSATESSPAPSRPAAAGSIPKTSRVAMLTALENYEIREYPIPELGDDDILVKVEGCGICGTDAHEFKRDPFGLIPLVLGHEGTGENRQNGEKRYKGQCGQTPFNWG